MTKEEFKYFIELMDHDYNAIQTPNLTIQYMHAKFGRIVSNEEMYEAVKKYNRTTKNIMKYIFSDEE